MPDILGLVLIALGSTAFPVQEHTRPAALVDADFEQDDLAAWFVPQPCLDAGFRASVSGDDPFAGENCALLEYTRTEAPRSFGNIIQSIAAEHLRGKRVRLRAAVRTEGAGRAQLWLREDGEERYSVLFDNMSDRPIRSGEWATYDIVGDVDPRATILVVGMMLFEGGKAFLDEVSVDVLGETDALLTGPRALAGRGLANLVAFTRLLGYVRHFHPSDQAETRDWGAVALAGASAVEDAPDDAELARRLQDFFAPIAPTVQVFASSSPPDPNPALAPPPDEKAKLTRWRNVGFGNDEPGRSIYYRRRDTQRLKDGKPSEGWTLPAEAYEAEIAPGVTARVPTVLWRDAEGTLPHGEAAGSYALPDSYLATGDDRGTRLAAVMLAWNVFQHFYPYFDVTEVDWPEELERALSAAATDAGQRAFLKTLQRMVAALHDGHGSVSHMVERMTAPPSVCWDWVEGELVILRRSADGKLAPGDVVTTIGADPTEVAFEDVSGFLSAATPQYSRHTALYELGTGEFGTMARLGVRAPDGTARTVEVPRGGPVEEERPAKIAELEPSIWYVDLGRIQDADFAGAAPDLARAKGIVFDLRGYPSVSTAPLAHLIDQPIECAQWLVPVALLPDQKATTFQKSSWKVEPAAPRFTARVAFLTDGRAISYAETYMGLVEHHRLAPIVGEPTAGTNGNVNPFVLPGRYGVSWTGMKVLKQDGARHHGVGIQPTVPCSRTIAGVAAGRDEQLERALAIVRG